MKKTKEKEIFEIIIPKGATTHVDIGLVKLTEFLTQKVFKGVWQGGGLLGGEYGYGVDYENDVFMMFPYYWGDCTCGFDKYEFKEEHIECYQNELDNAKIKAGWKRDKYNWLEAPQKWSYSSAQKIEDKIQKDLCKKYKLSYPFGCAVHCTCDYNERYKKWLKKIRYIDKHKESCLLEKPNFIFKPTDCKIIWYKWIGRGQEQVGKLPKDWVQQCKNSIKIKK